MELMAICLVLSAVNILAAEGGLMAFKSINEAPQTGEVEIYEEANAVIEKAPDTASLSIADHYTVAK